MLRQSILKVAGTVAMLGLVSACAGTPKPVPRLADEMRTSLGTVGVVTTGPAVGGNLDAPVGVGGQAALGVLKGGTIGLASGAGTGVLLGLVCGPAAVICSPIGGIFGATAGLVGGGIYGGMSRGRNAIPERIAMEIQAALVEAVADHELQADLRRRVLQHAGGSAVGTDLGAGAALPIASPDYTSLAGSGLGAVLEISLQQVVFAGGGGENPTLTLIISARSRLIRVVDKRVVWSVEEIRYESSSAAFNLWTARESSLLKAEIDSGLNDLARQIADALFIPVDPQVL